MEWIPLALNLLGILMASGGVWAWLAARSSAKAAKDSAAIAAQPQLQQATTADWTQLMAYWQSEMSALRDAAAKLDARVMFLESQREDDNIHISELEQHIWQHLPPPPPARRATPPKQ